jgi:hypothetical protein
MKRTIRWWEEREIETDETGEYCGEQCTYLSQSNWGPRCSVCSEHIILDYDERNSYTKARRSDFCRSFSRQ